MVHVDSMPTLGPVDMVILLTDPAVMRAWVLIVAAVLAMWAWL